MGELSGHVGFKRTSHSMNGNPSLGHVAGDIETLGLRVPVALDEPA